jgi:hypothetical protein
MDRSSNMRVVSCPGISLSKQVPNALAPDRLRSIRAQGRRPLENGEAGPDQGWADAWRADVEMPARAFKQRPRLNGKHRRVRPDERGNASLAC